MLVCVKEGYAELHWDNSIMLLLRGSSLVSRRGCFPVLHVSPAFPQSWDHFPTCGSTWEAR